MEKKRLGENICLVGDDFLNRAFHETRNNVDVLGLDDSFQIIFQNFCKIVLELGPPEMGQDLLPVGRTAMFAQVGLEFAGKNFERRRLADSIGSNQTQNLARSGRWEPVRKKKLRKNQEEMEKKSLMNK